MEAGDSEVVIAPAAVGEVDVSTESCGESTGGGGRFGERVSVSCVRVLEVEGAVEFVST